MPPIGIGVRPESTLPLHASAQGKLMLAFEQVRRVVGAARRGASRIAWDTPANSAQCLVAATAVPR
jgi:DNA-binding IclR family transcriptional regulator